MTPGSPGGRTSGSLVVVAPLALPPPVNGQSLINASMVFRLRQITSAVRLINTSPRSRYRTFRYHLRRSAAVASIPFILAMNIPHNRRCLYTVVEPGHGMLYNFLVIAAARCFGYALFLHHHASSYTKYRDGRFALLCRLAGKRATHIALSEQMALDLRDQYRSCARVIVAHNACHIPDPGGHGLSCPRERLTVGFLSNLSVEKGLDIVLQSYEAIRSKGVMARLLLAGPVVDKLGRRLIDEAQGKFGGTIVELGAVAGPSKQAFFSELDFFLFPSRYRYEAQPLVVLEALSYGAPALVTRQGYAGELVEVLGTATQASGFAAIAADFAHAWISDPRFCLAQRGAARARFLELVGISQRQTAQFLSLLQADG
jgi:glycosyltransferase involved in cell wall biosynthesis